ncbi:MAG TPA: FAD-dependent monooxygenase [Burkholderiales bacterium]|nr:FAD-dependent monooxygenase [Burkholderiales bacterium]
MLDVLIRGAGPVGCALALALRDSGLRVALLEAASPAPAFRPIALSYASRLILERLGVWTGLEGPAVTPIQRILVSQAGAFGRTRLDAADADVPALGYVTDYAALLSQLRARVQTTSEAADARCIVHAEGAPQDREGKRYPQDAIVGLLHAEPRSAATAFERFTAEGPLALLPFAGRYALIWSVRPERAERLVASTEAEFLRELNAIAGVAIGRGIKVEKRAVQPLVLKVRGARVEGNEVYIGNAAQTLHPVAGQGLNLGLRDAWDLARALIREVSPENLARFAAQRRLDAGATIRMTDFLAAGFAGDNALLRTARGAALTALDIFPAPRRFFARRMIFGAAALP